MSRGTHGSLKALAATALLSFGCAMPPPFPRAESDIQAPDHWGIEGNSSASKIEWWSEFGSTQLDTLIQEALEGNRDLAAAASRFEQAFIQMEISGGEQWPTLGLNLDGQRTKRNFIGFPSFGGGSGVQSTTSNSFSLSFSTSWELDVWGRIRSSVEASYGDAQSAAADFEAARLSLIGQVCKLWLSVSEAESQYRLARDSAQSFEETSTQVRDRYERGLRSSLDLRLALNSYHSAKALEAQRLDEIQRTRRNLEVMLGRYPSGSLKVDVPLPSLLPKTTQGIPSELLSSRPDVIAAERRLSALEARVDVARASLYPRISLSANAGTSSEELKDLLDSDFFVWSLIGNIAQPLFQGGRLRKEVSLAESRAFEAYRLWSGTLLQAFAEVEIALEGEQRVAERGRALARSVEQSSEALRLAEDRYLKGLEDFISVSDAQRSFLTAQSQYLSVLRRLSEQRVDLHLALGGGFRFDDLEPYFEEEETE